MKKILAIELYELQFEKEYLLAFVDDRNKELFTKEIPKSNREELLTTIKEQLQLYFKGRLIDPISK